MHSSGVFLYLFVDRLIGVKHSKSKANQLQDPSFTVGIIGCGRLGRHLAKCLLSFGEIPASSLKISTRRPELLGV